MEKRRESLSKRAIALILSLAMIIGIVGMVPPITAKADGTTVIKVPATLNVLERLTADTALTEGQYIYIDETGADMTGKLPTAISARVVYNTAPNSAKNYFTQSFTYINYDTTNVRSTNFDYCPQGAVVSNNGTDWLYYCNGSGVKNLRVYPYVSTSVQGYMYLTVNSNTITLDPDHPTYTVSANDITAVTYQVGEDEGSKTNLQSFQIDPNNNTVGDGDDTISILYGLNFSEHVDVELNMNYVVKFDEQGGVRNDSMANQTLDNENNTVATRPATDPTREGYTFKHWSLEKNGAAYDFNQTVNGARTIYAVWQLDEISSEDSYTLAYGDTAAIEATVIGGHEISYSVTSGDDVIAVDETGTIIPIMPGDAQVTITAHDTINALGRTKTVNVTVTKRDITVKANSKEITYGDEEPVFDYVLSENSPNQLVGDDSFDDGISFTGAVVRTDADNNNAGTYIIRKGNVDSDKYNIEFEEGTYTINPKPINITLDDQTKVYGDEDPELTYTLDEATPLAYEETIEEVITGAPEREEGKDVGTYVISPGDMAASNYAITFTNGTFEITKRPITLIAEDKEKFYGFKDPELTYTNAALTPLYEDDELEDIEVTLEREEGEKAGEYAIKATYVKTNNYDVEFLDGTFTVKKVKAGAKFDLEKKAGVKGVSINKTDKEMLDLTLSEDEWKMVDDGAGVRVYFEVTDTKATSSETSKIRDAAGLGYEIGETYDINLYKKFVHLDREQLFETKKKVKFTFKVSDKLTKVPDGYKREFKVVRIHGGKAEVIDSEFNAETNEVSFDSDRFSIFAVTYKDTSTMPAEIKKAVSNAVKTGDAIPMMSIMFLMAISAMGVGIIFKKKYSEMNFDI